MNDNNYMGTLVYHSLPGDKGLKAFPLKSRSCHIKYYEEYALSSFDRLICSLLYKQDDYSLNVIILGCKLGFDIDDDALNNCFYDEAENNIFKMMLEEVRSWGLIKIENDIASLTPLGLISFSSNYKYRFYEADTDCLEFPSLLSVDGDSISLFPFFDELGAKCVLTHCKTLEYTDECADYINVDNKSLLIQNLQLQTDLHCVIFEAELHSSPHIGIVPTNLEVELYEKDKSYTIAFIHNGNYCERLNQLFNASVNSKVKDNKVEWALYSKIMNDKDAHLTYELLSPFEDILEIEKLIPDKRIVWEDYNLLQLLIQYCDADNWHALSKYCDPHVLEGIVEKYSDFLDWSELTIRLDDDFLIKYHSKYPWVPQLLIEREPVNAELIKHFLVNYNFPDGKDDGEWEWDEIIPILGFDFVSQHISNIPFNLSSLTKELDDKIFILIKDHPEASWDWHYISSDYPLDYVLENVDTFSGYLLLPILLDRVFTDVSYSKKGAETRSLRKVVETNMSKISNYFSVNEKPYLWSDKVIEFFENSHMLFWEGGLYQRGFVYNRSLVWDYSFFSKYYQKLTSQESFNYISAKIVDNKIIDDFSTFPWNWDILSRNKIVFDDIDFVKSHLSLLNAPVVLLNCSSNLIEDYFYIFDANSLMSDDAALKLKITDSVSVDFIRKNISCPWDWSNVTRRVYKTIKIDSIGNEAWRDKWDWNFLSEKLSESIIIDYAEKYADKWNWLIILRRLDQEFLTRPDVLPRLLHIFVSLDDAKQEWSYLSNVLPVETIIEYVDDYSSCWAWDKVLQRITADLLLKENVLDKLQSVIVDLENRDYLWSIITGKFDTQQLIEAISIYSEDKYLWNYDDLYSRSTFVAKDYLDNYVDLVKWSAFSSSVSVNKMFEKSRSKKTRSLWLRIFRDYLEKSDYLWDFSALSHLQNILEEPRLLQLNKDWDWDFISEHATWINTDKDDNYFFLKFIDKLSFEKLSFRVDINLSEDIIKKYDSKYQWNWHALTENTSVNYTLGFISEYIDKPWHWNEISKRDDLTMSFLTEHKEKDWDWYEVTSKTSFEPSIDLLSHVGMIGGQVNWDSISENPKLPLSVINEYQSSVNWSILIGQNSKFLDIAKELVEFVSEYLQYIPWDVLNKRIDVNITNGLLEAYPSCIDWHNASKSQSLDFTIELVKRYEEKWYWHELSKNLKFREDIPNYESVFNTKVKIVRFLSRFDTVGRKPYIYHFTHLFNAIDVIKSRKILSRDRASELGLLRFDSAGSVVYRSGAAHGFARFYFRPCTPTQYYNEALGADSQLGEMGYGRPIYDGFTGEKYFPRVWKSKYPKALGLGLPKCPIPVFFRFDIEEVLSSMPELCYYSDRNMQSNNPCVYKVLDNPDCLGVEYLYDTMAEAKSRAKRGGGYDSSEIDRYMKYSQQEFLIKSEFDFSKLNSLLIICYDSKYTEILKKIFKDDPICDKIVNDRSIPEVLFERENRCIYLRQQINSFTLSSDFRDEYYYRIKSSFLSKIDFDLSSAHVFKESADELKLSGIIKWNKTDYPFEVFFVDPNARTQEWLIYSNSYMSTSVSSKFKMENPIGRLINSFVSKMESIPIKLSKDLFYPHMVNSYHGIAHTSRVLLASYLLCNTIEMSEQEKNACCLAAIIHDLGKRSDREGAEHGFNSMELYKEKIKMLIDDAELQSRTLNAVRYHSVEDKDCPNDVCQDIIWKVLKDSDALDRSRFGGRGCDKSYLRLGLYQTDVGQNIIDLTSYLPGWSEALDWEHPCEGLIEQIHKYAE